MKKIRVIYSLMIALLLMTIITPQTLSAQEADTQGSLTIYKYEQEEGTERVEGDGEEHNGIIEGELLAGVEFTLTQTHTYNADTDEWTAVSGTPQTYTTGSDGKITIDSIPLGRYKVQETNGPAHVVLNDEVFTVDIPMTTEDGSNLIYDVHIYPKNETIRGSVDMFKYDGNTEQGLAGVVFELYHEDGTRVKDKDGNEIPALTTDGDGHIHVDGLSYGDYYLVEVATIDGYMLKGEKVSFSVNEQGAVATVSLANYEEPEIDKEISEPAVNRGDVVTYTLTVDLPADIDTYESFTVTDVLHEHLEYVSGSEVSPDAFTFSENGQTLTWDLNTSQATGGQYTITFDAKIAADAVANEPIENKATIDYDNHYETDGKTTPPVTVTPTTGSLLVLKQDGDTEKPLAGAEFELRDADGNVVATGTSNANGQVDFNGATDELDFGTYTLVETKAPEGYSLLKNPKEITINEDQAEQVLTVNNFLSDWELPKTGGIGTIGFTAGGILLMVGAAYLFFRRKQTQ